MGCAKKTGKGCVAPSTENRSEEGIRPRAGARYVILLFDVEDQAGHLCPTNSYRVILTQARCTKIEILYDTSLMPGSSSLVSQRSEQ